MNQNKAAAASGINASAIVKVEITDRSFINMALALSVPILLWAVAQIFIVKK